MVVKDLIILILEELSTMDYFLTGALLYYSQRWYFRKFNVLFIFKSVYISLLGNNFRLKMNSQKYVKHRTLYSKHLS